MFSNAKIIDLGKANQWKTLPDGDMTQVGEAATGTGYGIGCKLTDRDSRYVIMVTNTSSTTAAEVKVAAGNSFMSTGKQPAISLAAGATAFIQVESGVCKYVENKGDMAGEAGDEGAVDKVFVLSDKSTVKACVLHTVL